MNKRANKSMNTKDKNEKWPIRPTGHQKILLPNIKYRVNKKVFTANENNYTKLSICTAKI